MHAMDDDARAARSARIRPGVTEENIQARIRGNLLMALSNKRGALLLTTGNKSGARRSATARYTATCPGGLGGDRRRAEDDGLSRGALAEQTRRTAADSRGDA